MEASFHCCSGDYVRVAILTISWPKVIAECRHRFNGAGGIAGAYIVRQKEAPRYVTAVSVSIGSHVLIILLVSAFSAYFYFANRRQRAGKAILENTEGFRYTF